MFYSERRAEAGRRLVPSRYLLLNLAPEKVVRILQDNEGDVLINQNNIWLLRFADDLVIIGEEATKKIDLRKPKSILRKQK